MRTMLVCLLWLASTALLGAYSTNSWGADLYLTDEQLRDPQFVANWLAANKSNADRKGAKLAFELGLRYKQRKNWSAAAKNFGESMIRYPSPQVLIEYADVLALDMGQIRTRNKVLDKHKLSDMKSSMVFYQSALAANTVLNTLSAKEKTQAQSNVNCLSAFVNSNGQPQPSCPPLRAYGIQR